MPVEDQYDEYVEAFDAVYAAMLANTTARITPPVLYLAPGNLRAATGALTEVLPNLARATRTGAEDLELHDSEGNDPHKQLTALPEQPRGRHPHSAPTAHPTRRRPKPDQQRRIPGVAYGLRSSVSDTYWTA